MNIIESTNVDLISPFPLQEIPRILTWMHCYKSMLTTDHSPQTPEDNLEFFKDYLPKILSFGVIDKANKLNIHHEAPLIGIIMFEPQTPTNGYFHVTSSRKAWGSRLIDEGGVAAINHVFSALPSLTRVSAVILNKNYPAKGLAKRLGFKQDGLLEDWVTQSNVPMDVAHFGLLRSAWQADRSISPAQE